MTKAKKRGAKMYAVQFYSRIDGCYKLAAIPIPGADFALCGITAKKTDADAFKRAWNARGPIKGRIIEARLTWSDPTPKRSATR